MNTQQLAAFREVMKTGSVSQAARNLRRTQPAISANLKSLESHLGQRLFLREGRRLIPVPEAHYLLEEATEILNRIQTAEQNLSNMGNRLQGTLRIAAMPGPSSYLLPTFLSDFIRDTPDVRVVLTTRSSPQIRNLIATQSFDIGFCDISINSERKKLYNIASIYCDCVCAVPASHALATRKEINATDLHTVPMGALQPDHLTYQQTKSVFEQEGVVFDPSINAQYFLPLFHFVEAGQLCAVVDVLSAASYLQSQGNASKIVFLPFRPRVPFGYSTLTPSQRPLSRLASSFVEAWSANVMTKIDSIRTSN